MNVHEVGTHIEGDGATLNVYVVVFVNGCARLEAACDECDEV